MGETLEARRLISVQDALRIILDTVTPLAGERVGLTDALDRVLAEDVRTERDVPPLPNSAMDGYAVRADDISEATATRPASLRLLEVIQAGALPRETVVAGRRARS